MRGGKHKIVGLTVAAGLFLFAENASAAGFNLLQAILNGVAIGHAQKAWSETDQAIRDCLANKYHIDVIQLAQHGMGPTDQRVQPYVIGCQNDITAEENQAEQARQARAQSQRAAAEQLAREQHAAAEQLKAQRAAEAAEKVAAQKRRIELVAKYGQKMADAIASHVVSIGMTKDQVLAARGEPISRQVVPPSDELWKYGAADQIVITNGRVSYVGH